MTQQKQSYTEGEVYGWNTFVTVWGSPKNARQTHGQIVKTGLTDKAHWLLANMMLNVRWLLVAHPRYNVNRNTLRLCACMSNATNPVPCYETVVLDAVKKLRKDNLLLKDFMKDHEGSWRIMKDHEGSRPLVLVILSTIGECDPDNLMSGTYYTNYHSFMQTIKHETDLTRFTIYFQSALKHHPKHLGVLCQRDIAVDLHLAQSHCRMIACFR